MYKKEFVRRLIRLGRAINDTLAFGNDYDLFPSLFSVYTFLWTSNKAFKKK